MKEREEVLTVTDVAAFLKRTPAAIRQAVARHKLPFKRDGRKLVFLRRDLEVYLESLPGVCLEDIQREQRNRMS